MKQNYKIHTQNSTLKLVNSGQDFDNWDANSSHSQSIEFEGVESLKYQIESLENSKEAKSLLIVFPESVSIEESLLEIYKQITAAGGYVLSKEGKLLMIHRLGKWDLPKGKMEKGEGIEETAVREVEEETACKIEQVMDGPFKTLHTYSLKDKKILKTTYWYSMLAEDSPELKAQSEEGIEQVCWMTDSEVQKALENTFQSIVEVVDHFSKKAK